MDPALERSPGPGVYDPQSYNEIGKESRLKFIPKKIEFGSHEKRSFTLNRSLNSPFVETTILENPSPG